MKNIYILLLLAVACKKEDATIDISSPVIITPANLILNGSFEQGGVASFMHWNFPDGPCCTDTFSTDVPPPGGMYSLKLQPQWLPGEGAAETYVTGLTANNAFLLKFYGKCNNAPPQRVYVSVYRKGFAIAGVPSITFSDSVWTPYQLTTGIIQLQPTDTLAVRLSAGSTEVANWEALFDHVELFKLP